MKKFIAMLLVLTMAMAFVACAETDNTDSSSVAESSEAVNSTAESSVADEETSADESVADYGAMTHDEYMAAEIDSEVTIETYVQAHQSWWDNKITVYCQSPDGAYFLYELQCSEEDSAKLVPGTHILVKGYKGEWSGEIEVMDGTFEFLDDGSTYIAEAFDATELLGTDELLNHQNEFAAFNGMTVEKIEYKNGEPGDDIYVTLGYNGASYDFCVEYYLTGTDSDVYTTVGELEVGDVVNVEGFLYWYESVNPHITSITVAE